MGFLSGLFGKREKIVRDIPRGPGTFQLQDVYNIKGVGRIAVGKVLSGSLHVGQKGFVNGKTVIVKSIEMHHQQLPAAVGDNIGIHLKGLTTEDANILKRDPSRQPLIVDFS